MQGQLLKIVVAMDSSAYALTAAHWGARLAARSGAELTLVHVLEVRLLNAPFFADLGGALGASPCEHLQDALDTAFAERAKNILAAGVQICTHAGVAARTQIVRGVFAEAIRSVAEDANLLILGRRGESAGHGSYLMGSDGERALRHVACSCLVVPEEFVEPRRLLVGIDDGGPARAASSWAGYLHELYPDWQLTPLHVAPKGTDPRFAELRVDGVPVKVVPGHPERTIVAECEQAPEQTLCVLGARGESRGLMELILGTLPFHVLHQTHGPVLLAR